ncbi:MAG: flagellar hook-associated protein FlgL [Rhodoferax sp.]
MQISTSLMFDRAGAQMSNLQNDLNRSQAQIASQKQILNPSDAPDQAAGISRLKSIIGRQDSFASNITTAQTRLNTEDSTLGNATNALVRMKELAIQAANGTNDATTRLAIANEMQGMRDQLLSLANTQDTTGSYIYAGSKTKTPAFQTAADGTVSYQGDQVRTKIEVGEHSTVTLNRPGTSAFVRVVRTAADGTNTGVGFFQSLDDLITAVKTGNASEVQRGMGEVDSLTNGIVLARADAGTSLSVLDQQNSILTDTKLTLKTALSSSEDLDYASAITKMNVQMTALQAAQASFSKISQLSLFNYLK